MVLVYALALENDKYYIGKVQYDVDRLPDVDILCKLKDGGPWTTTHPPVCVIEYIPGCDDYDQDKYTVMYMERYGIENVRGGSFSKEHIDTSQIQVIRRMIRTAKNQCYTCGKNGHLQRECSEEKWRQIQRRCYTCSDCTPHTVDKCPNRVYKSKFPSSAHFQEWTHQPFPPSSAQTQEPTTTLLLGKQQQLRSNASLQQLYQKIRNFF